MIPAAFDYTTPTSMDEALSLLQQHGDEAKILTGGHSLIPLMKLRLAQPGMVIDLRNVSELRTIEMRDGSLHIGAAATHDAVQQSDLVSSHCPMLAACASEIGDLQVRNVGTIGGSVVHADPAADWPAALLAADATFELQGPDGKRQVPAVDFFVSMMESATQENEILTGITVPSAGPHGGSYLKMKQSASGFAICGVAAMVTMDGDKVAKARIGITGVADVPYRGTAVEAALEGTAGTADDVASAAAQAAEGRMALEDLHATAAYRTHLATVFCKRAINAALASARQTQ